MQGILYSTTLQIRDLCCNVFTYVCHVFMQSLEFLSVILTYFCCDFHGFLKWWRFLLSVTVMWNRILTIDFERNKKINIFRRHLHLQTFPNISFLLNMFKKKLSSLIFSNFYIVYFNNVFILFVSVSLL